MQPDAAAGYPVIDAYTAAATNVVTEQLVPPDSPTRAWRSSATSLDTPLRVLAICADSECSQRIENARSLGGWDVDTEICDSFEDGLDRLQHAGFHAVVLELGLIEPELRRALLRIRRSAPEAAIIALTSGSDPEAALFAMNHGADEYLVYEAFDEYLVMRVVRHAIERRVWKEGLERIERLSVDLYETLDIGVFEIEMDGRLRSANAAFARMLGLHKDTVAAAFGRDTFQGSYGLSDWLMELGRARGAVRRPLTLTTSAGTEVVGMACVHPSYDRGGHRVGYRGVMIDITDVVASVVGD